MSERRAGAASRRAGRAAGRAGSLAAAPLTVLEGVGPKRQQVCAEAGIETLGDLLLHLPARYEDRRSQVRLSDALARVRSGESVLAVTLTGSLSGLRRVATRRRRFTLVQGRLQDGDATVDVVWFNRPYLPQQVVPGETYALHGELRRGPRGIQLVNPSCEPASRALASGQVVPVYPSLGPLGPAAARRLLATLCERFDVAQEIPDPLPARLLERHRLPALGAALAALHMPGRDADVDALNRWRSPAHHRLIYGELLELQLQVAAVRAAKLAVPKEHRYRVDDQVRGVAREVLPFRLTGAQRRVLKEIVDDLRQPTPMLRLVQGDVGCGKTILAALAMVIAMESGLQAAFMAPTELLAEQHYATLARLLGSRYRLALVTASGSDGESRRAVEQGEVQLAVGTHALIQERVRFRALALAVIDEQHRFGVAQRQLLQQKGRRVDMLVMTATPIPRSLALTAYGDLDLSVVDELPPGRLPVTTSVRPESAREQVWEELRRELEAGGRGYVVFPLIEESDRVAAAAVEEMADRLARHLHPFVTAKVHGRTPRDERDRIMQDFAAGHVRALLATTVIEVGVDVPEATVMVIESAQRFGLAQLHQLRGRVGRSRLRSRCIALHGPLSPDGERRLAVFAESADGFRIAEADLEIRGPGDLLGTRQAGVPQLRVANLVRDQEWLAKARQDARQLVPDLAAGALADLRRSYAGGRLPYPFAGG